ncbi:MAG: hypothetical protein JSS81_20895 [Acidobacteria bacterium]|nr:hypothetical protein [Acidobacteriota bacterium]
MRIFLVLIVLTAMLAGCGSNPSPESPSGVFRRYVEASQKQDVATMKSLLSKSSLELIEKTVAPQKMTVDDVLRQESMVKIAKIPETRSERIEGETATIEVKNETTGQFDVVYPFVRENGAWKLARDKYIEQMLKKP